MQRVWDVIPFAPLAAGGRQTFSYASPARGPEPHPGMLVRVPFGKRAVQGIVLKRGAPVRRRGVVLKPIERVLSEGPLLAAADLAVVERFAAASLEPLASLVKSAALVRLPLARGGPPSPPRPPRRPPRFRVSVRWTDAASALPKRLAGQLLLLAPEAVVADEAYRMLTERNVPVARFAQGQRIRDRRALLTRLRRGETVAVIATHAGVFLPLPALAAVIVLEAALASHRQWDLHPRYDARVGALLLARERGVPLTLQSSLPSLDLLLLEQIKKYPSKSQAPKTTSPISHKLKAKSWTILPRSPRDPLLSPEPINLLRDAADRGGRVLLFHDLAGMERAFRCASCGYLLQCGACGGTLERVERDLRCRSCGTGAGPVLHFCPRCRSPHIGPRGIGTAALTRDLQRAFPHVTLSRLDRDTLPRRRLKQPWRRETESGIWIGTERAFAVLEPETFDHLIVLSADRVLEEPRFDAAERFAALLARLARLARPQATLHLQTTHPHLPVVRAHVEGTRTAWMAEELADRKTLGYPPATALLHLEKVFPTPEKALIAARNVSAQLTTRDSRLAVGFRTAGPRANPRAEILLRGPLPHLQRALPRLPAGWSTDPHIPLSPLISHPEGSAAGGD